MIWLVMIASGLMTFAARFSMILSIPIILGSGILKAGDLLPASVN